MKVCIVSSSQSENSHSRALAHKIEYYMNQMEVVTQFWDLKERPINTLIPEYHHEVYKNTDSNILDFIKNIDTSDGVVLVTPVYHGSYSGHLKIALDQLSKSALKDKIIACVSHGHNILKSALPPAHLRTVIASMSGHCITTDICTCVKDFLPHDKEIKEPSNEILLRIKMLTTEMIQLGGKINVKTS